MLPPNDLAYLETRFSTFQVALEAQMHCVVIADFPVPNGLQPQRSNLLLRLAPGYPDIAPDMWWFNPSITRPDGRAIPQTEVRERHLGEAWQRWSRHLNPGQWKPGIDCLRTYVALVNAELSAAA